MIDFTKVQDPLLEAVYIDGTVEIIREHRRSATGATRIIELEFRTPEETKAFFIKQFEFLRFLKKSTKVIGNSIFVFDKF